VRDFGARQGAFPQEYRRYFKGKQRSEGLIAFGNQSRYATDSFKSPI
jgi:hypothetical protein